MFAPLTPGEAFVAGVAVGLGFVGLLWFHAERLRSRFGLGKER